MIRDPKAADIRTQFSVYISKTWRNGNSNRNRKTQAHSLTFLMIRVLTNNNDFKFRERSIIESIKNKQGHDEGTRYRTGIYYTDVEDLPIIEKVYTEEQQHYNQPLAVEKQPLVRFYTAEEYHQNYLDKNPNGYCHLPQSLFEFARMAKDPKRK